VADQAQYEFESIGTRWWCEMLDDSVFSPAIIHDIAVICDEFDRRYSRFRDDSLVAELARTGVLVNPPEELLRMLDFAHEMEQVSEGAFTIAVGPALHRLGYGARTHGGTVRKSIWEDITYDTQKVTIPKGVMLDFGGQGKGWLIDRLADVFRQHGVKQFIINGGGDLFVQSDAPVELALEDPYDASKMVGKVMLTTGALAASSTLRRTWRSETGDHHHIIDPVTGQSSKTGIAASFVTAPTALVADTMATILILRPELEATLAARYRLQTKLLRMSNGSSLQR
jgi:thiamine biosynthesis lipoprotein